MSQRLAVPFVALDRQYSRYKEELDVAFGRVASSGMYVLGPDVEAFEGELAKICDVPHVLTLANGTDALILALRVLGVGEGDEVITAPNSFIASAGAIVAVGATPVFADIREDHNIDPAAVERCITEKTKAIMPVHLTGRPAAMDEINVIAKANGLFVVEDAAQAIGARYKGRAVGSLGDVGCFSLHPLKNLFVMGDGGFLTVKDTVLFEKLKILRNHGLLDRNTCSQWAINSRLDSLHAAMGLVKVKHFEAITKRFRAIAERYRNSLKDVLEVPSDTEDEFAVYHNFVVCTDRRDELMAHLKLNDIGCAVHYPIPLHLQPAANELGYKKGDFPVTERQNTRQLSLPIFPELTELEIDAVIAAIRDFFQ